MTALSAFILWIVAFGTGILITHYAWSVFWAGEKVRIKQLQKDLAREEENHKKCEDLLIEGNRLLREKDEIFAEHIEELDRYHDPNVYLKDRM